MFSDYQLPSFHTQKYVTNSNIGPPWPDCHRNASFIMAMMTKNHTAWQSLISIHLYETILQKDYSASIHWSVSYARVYFPQMCSMKTEAMKSSDMTSTGTGPLTTHNINMPITITHKHTMIHKVSSYSKPNLISCWQHHLIRNLRKLCSRA